MTTIGSLFTGYGGLDMGVAMALDPGARVAWTSDVEPGPCRLADVRWPCTPNLGDVTKVDWDAVEPVDVICGGSPCQDLSLAGHRAGMTADTRSGLWESMAAAIKTIQPRLVVWENVIGALSARATSPVESEPGMLGNISTEPALRAAGRVAGDLASLGYDARWRVIRACDAGAPHQRARLFLIGHPHGQPWQLRREPTTEKTRQSGPLSEPRGPNRTPVNQVQPLQLLPTPQATNATYSGSGYGANLHEISSQNERRLFGTYEPAIIKWEYVHWGPAPEPTEPPQRPGRRPRLSTQFVEWMMGLPQGHVTGPDLALPREQQLRMLGNGVVPQQAALAVETLVRLRAI